MEQFFGAERGRSGDAHDSDTRDYSGVSTLTQETLNFPVLMSFSGEEHLSLCLGIRASCPSLSSGVSGHSCPVHTESLCFQPSAPLAASKPRLLGLNDSHFFAASLVNFLRFRSLCLFVHPLPSSFYLLEFV